MALSPILSARHVAKNYGAVAALKDASLDVAPGEVIALMGANGAGKSTLVKILTGAISPSAGEITIRGTPYKVSSPADARRAGLVPVYQEPSLIPDLNILDNLKLGGTPVELFRHWLGELGVPDVDLIELARHQPLAVQRVIDLARALASEPAILLLDEMTAALPANLVDRVLDVVKQQKPLERSVIYISHRFPEIATVCDRAMVLRDGKTVGDLAITDGVEEEIVELMLGDAIKSQKRAYAAASVGAALKPRLEVSQLSAGSKLTDVSFELRAGEVLGVVALEGQGQDELFEVLAGMAQPDGGGFSIDGTPCRFKHPADAIAAGHVYVPGDRAEALLMQRSVRENIAIPFHTKPSQWGLIDMAAENTKVAAAIDRLQIDTRAQGEVQRLSGGNQQKVTIARWLAMGFQTILCFDPTRGIDVRTKHQIYPLLRELAEQGSSVLFYTSELAEVQQACDRVVVIFNGKVVDQMAAEHADEPTLMRAAYGLTADETLPEAAQTAAPGPVV